ncbi:MAG: cell division protein FtsH, partial [Gemmatimonadaceae bacterium]
EVFLGRELGHRREVSERTSQLVDSEVERVIREAYTRALDTLSANLDLLHSVAGSLLERETLTGDEVLALARGEQLPPRAPEPPVQPPAVIAAVATQAKTAKKPLLAGPEPAPA